MIVKHLTIGLTTICKMNRSNACGFCFRGISQQKIPSINLDINILKNRFSSDFLNELQSLHICGGMGDFVFYPHIFKLIEHLRGYEIDLSIDTVGISKNSKWWSELANTLKGLNYKVRFGIDGIGAIHNIYRIGCDFDEVIRNAKTFIDAGGEATWKFILFKHNEHQLESAQKMARDLGFKSFMTVISCFYDEVYQKPTGYNKPEIRDIDCRFIRDNSISIEADGNIMPCINYKPLKRALMNEEIYWNDIKVMLKYSKCKRKLNLYTSTIREAVESEFFSYILQNYKNLKNCQWYCGSKGRSQDIIISEDLPLEKLKLRGLINV